MKIFKKILPLIFILVVSVFTILPFFNSGFFPIHDDTQVARVYEMSKSLKDGMFPVRWVADLGYGYGYPIFNFYDPLPYYIGGVISLLGLNALLATKIMMALGIILAGASMYFLARQFWGEMGGILSALFYAYAPYHALDIYVRGDVAEFWAYGFIPLVFYGLWKIKTQGKWRYVVVSSTAFAFVITSHNLVALMVTPFLITFASYLILKSRKKKLSAYIAASFVIGVLLSAFYWLPAILELPYTHVSSILTGGSNFRDNFVCLSQLWTSPWGYGGSTKGCVDGLSFMIGKYHILLVTLLSIFVILTFVFKKYGNSFEKDKLAIIVLSTLGFLFSVFLTLEVSRPLWELIRPMEFFQYPWRFLLMIVFFSSFTSGAIFWIFEKSIKNKKLLLVGLLLASSFFVFVSLKFFTPEKYLAVNSDYYTNPYALEWTTSKISDEYMPASFQAPKSPNDRADFLKLNSKTIKIEKVAKRTQEIIMETRATQNQEIVVPLAFYPSWKGYLNEKEVPLFENAKGILVNIPQGEHRLRLTFKQTPVELLANLLTVVGILSLFIGIIHLRKRYA